MAPEAIALSTELRVQVVFYYIILKIAMPFWTKIKETTVPIDGIGVFWYNERDKKEEYYEDKPW